MTKGYENDTQSTQKILSTTITAPILTWGIVFIALVSCLLMLLILVGLILSLVILIRKKWPIIRRQHHPEQPPQLPLRLLLAKGTTLNRQTIQSTSPRVHHGIHEPCRNRYAELAIAPDDYYVGPHGGGISVPPPPTAAFALTQETHEKEASNFDVENPPTSLSHQVYTEIETPVQTSNITSEAVQGSSASQHTLDLPNSPQAPHVLVNYQEAENGANACGIDIPTDDGHTSTFTFEN